MNWKPIYAVLLLASTLVTYGCGVLLEKYNGNTKRKKLFLVVSLLLNFGVLFVFKYYNFINESIFDLLTMCGLRWNVPNLDILLPIGISFYTFQAIGYTIDVYRGDIKAERNFITYALFVSFFPQIAAGPIGRAKSLLPQFKEEHTLQYSNVSEGLRQMLWGFFMKLCVADVLCAYVDAVYNNVPNHNGSSIILATILFTFQIYCDFGGYSNIAIGTAKVMGFKLMENFNRPYFSLSVKEFWKRWHISLSSWFMDYLYIPLGGNRVKYPRHLFNLMVTFLVSGIWHGANWTFVLWGALHGTYQVAGNAFRKYVYTPPYKTLFSRVLSALFCFVLISFAWLFFRANSIDDAFLMVNKMFTDLGSLFIDTSTFIYGFMGLFILILKDVKDEFGWKLNFMHSKYVVVRYASVVCLISYILLFGSLNGGQFIYFQF